MSEELPERDEVFLRLALEQKTLTDDRIFLLRQEKPFYPDKSIGEVAVIKGYLDANQVRDLYQLAEKKDAAADTETHAATAQAGGQQQGEANVQGPIVEVAEPVAAEPAGPGTEQAASGVEIAAEPAASEVPFLADEEVRSFSRLEQYLSYARAHQASDLHLSPGYSPYVRRFGRFCFLDHPAFEEDEAGDLILSVLTDEQRAQLKERLNLECALEIEGHGRYRTTIIRQRSGWDGTFRVIRSKVPTTDELGLPEAALRLADYRQGMVLVTGPGGCGKTSTMAALVDYINARRREHIVTLEQPIEYIFEAKKAHVTQREVGAHTTSYQRGLRAALREDPDAILLGEMRDLETISMAITAAETGHLIFGTLHTTTAARTISRILDSYPPDQQPQIRTMMGESLRGIICQQLIPRIDREGVALAIEILVVTPGIASLIREMKIHQIVSSMQTGKRLGMVRMDDSLMELYKQGAIAIEEAHARADDKRAFAALMSG